MPDSSPSPPRRRGAPPGNTNALKHGYYSARFAPRTPGAAVDLKASGLADEIDLLRAFLRRVIYLSASQSSLSADLALLRVASLAANTLGRLVRTQRFFAEYGGVTIDDVLDEIFRELREVDKIPILVEGP